MPLVLSRKEGQSLEIDGPVRVYLAKRHRNSRGAKRVTFAFDGADGSRSMFTLYHDEPKDLTSGVLWVQTASGPTAILCFDGPGRVMRSEILEPDLGGES